MNSLIYKALAEGNIHSTNDTCFKNYFLISSYLKHFRYQQNENCTLSFNANPQANRISFERAWSIHLSRSDRASALRSRIIGHERTIRNRRGPTGRETLAQSLTQTTQVVSLLFLLDGARAANTTRWRGNIERGENCRAGEAKCITPRARATVAIFFLSPPPRGFHELFYARRKGRGHCREWLLACASSRCIQFAVSLSLFFLFLSLSLSFRLTISRYRELWVLIKDRGEDNATFSLEAEGEWEWEFRWRLFRTRWVYEVMVFF